MACALHGHIMSTCGSCTTLVVVRVRVASVLHGHMKATYGVMDKRAQKGYILLIFGVG